MPSNREELRAAERYRAQQLRTRALFLAQFVTLWPMLDPEDVEGSSQPWLTATLPLITTWFDRSADQARGYYAAAAGLPVDVPPVRLLRTAAIGALLVTGPGSIRRALAAGMTPRQAGDQGLANASRSAGRLAMSGGRETLAAAVAVDPRARGWMRVTDSSPCSFCAMLAGRGAVYRSARSAGEINRFHDGCGCAVVPVFTDNPVLPAASEEFADLWESTTQNLSGNNARNAFRRAVEGR